MSPGAAVADRHVRKPLGCPLVRPEAPTPGEHRRQVRHNLTVSPSNFSLPTTQAMAAEGRGQMFTAPIFDADQHMYESPEALTRYLPERYQRAAARFVRAISASSCSASRRPHSQAFSAGAPAGARPRPRPRPQTPQPARIAANHQRKPEITNAADEPRTAHTAAGPEPINRRTSDWRRRNDRGRSRGDPLRAAPRPRPRRVPSDTASCSSIRPAGSRGCWTTDSDSFVIHVVTSTLGLPCGRSGLRVPPSRLLLDDIVKLGVVSKDTGRRVGHEQVGRDS